MISKITISLPSTTLMIDAKNFVENQAIVLTLENGNTYQTLPMIYLPTHYGMTDIRIDGKVVRKHCWNIVFEFPEKIKLVALTRISAPYEVVGKLEVGCSLEEFGR